MQKYSSSTLQLYDHDIQIGDLVIQRSQTWLKDDPNAYTITLLVVGFHPRSGHDDNLGGMMADCCVIGATNTHYWKAKIGEVMPWNLFMMKIEYLQIYKFGR